MNRRVILMFALAALILVPSAVQAQRGAVSPSGIFGVLVDPIAQTLTSINFSPSQASRGHTYGPDGKVYASWWTTNGIGVLDTLSGTWTTLVADTTNRIMGAPYQPVFNNEAVGGPGIWCIDGNPTPTSSIHRNTFLVDVNAQTFGMDAIFPNTYTPMSDSYAHPYKAGEFLGVGFSTSDQNILSFPITGAPTTITPTVITSLTYPCQYDALIHEDTQLYCWTASSTFLGFEKVNLVTGATTAVPVKGITYYTSYASCWEEPWELPGRKAYVVYRTAATTVGLFEVDLSTNPAVATAIAVKPAFVSADYTTGRSEEETQLYSYWAGAGRTGRVFSMNFFANNGGKSYILAPTLLGYGGPTVIGSKELWIIPDGFTALAAANLLPGAAGQTVGLLSRSGTAQVKFDLGVKLGIDIIWIAAVIDKGQILDISNTINIKL